MTDQFRTVAVIGAGTIGLSWTALFAAHGLTVRVSDPRPDLAEATAEALAVFGPHLAAQGLDTDGPTDRVHLAADITEAVRDADVVQENGPERVEFKKELFARLVREAPGHALLLSSSLAIPSSVFTTEIEDAGRILIGHPCNPPHLLPLVEVAPGEHTTAEAVQCAVALYTSVGRTPVVERQEVPGFVGNRLQNALNRQAVHLVQQGVITPEDLDTVTHSLGIRHAAVGPFLGGHLGGYRHIAEHIGSTMQQLDLDEPSQDPQDRERVIRAVEKAYAATPYADLAEARDRAQLAVLSALADVRRNQKEN
ncbi:3-hydroxyacyl-CoA dehydrogenase NAD-binding domain-containing protein [Streptomyces sasae]|uniref:3-hydroxyacyl-CoA dehydrogenase NAD-binding domain-containing protein n=1 Tax=Streptomyces sasae TaxID=1266772 RepID=UPI00292E9A66|nr:3-hydroxyacyl-CoA dehydrogenase NAD-binding domain-containing protein [Streptomyces sasae]